MKKTIVKITATTIGIFFSVAAFAQQPAAAKPPQVSGPVLQTSQENKVQQPPATTDKDLHQTAGKQSSFTGTVPVKAKDEAQPAKVPENKQQLPETDKLVPPSRAAIKNG
jgi:hypothetical protein